MLKPLIIISLILFTIQQALAFPGEARRYFKDWLVVCQKEARDSSSAGKCRANTSIRDKKRFPYGDGTIFQLTLERNAQSDYHIRFYHTLNGSYPSGTATLQFDNAKPITLDTKIEGNSAQLSVVQTRPLIDKFKSAHWLKVRYTSQTGKPIEMRVSLKGATASLLYIKEFYDFRRD